MKNMSQIEKVLAALWGSDLIEIQQNEDCFPVKISDNNKLLSDKDYSIKLEDSDKYFPPFYFNLKDFEAAEVNKNRITLKGLNVLFYKLVPNNL